ncbi:Gfo/Idh/MocA family oxidoreductase [Actinosynnema sp. NPDC053489]|uniref:Gfo/Idh/MocA family oxidoreductase n=1 Tax=Actinosynnema sp. NPDC053489 TaxID=3363916 RepID=UPI0037CBDCAA
MCTARGRYAVVGTGARAELHVDAIVRHAGQGGLVAFCDVNPTRMAVRDSRLDRPVPAYATADFLRMVEWERVDVVVVCAVDRHHGAYVVEALDKANSGGLLVHKATHHFDLLDWWTGAVPEVVYAQGRLFFYGEGNGERHGHRRLYLDAEHEDGCHRDRDPFAPGVSIEDHLAVLVRYPGGASLNHHLTACSPWEGYRLMVNGSRGRLEPEVVENSWVSGPRCTAGANPEEGHARLTVQPLFGRAVEVGVAAGGAGHGGADARMTAALYGPAGRPDPLGRRADHRAGALSLATGFAANRSLETGSAVRVAESWGRGWR